MEHISPESPLSECLKLGSREKYLSHARLAGTLLIAKDDDSVLLGNARNTYLWGNFAGSVEEDETPWGAAIRETFEESRVLVPPEAEVAPLVMVIPPSKGPITFETIDIGACYPVFIPGNTPLPEPTSEMQGFQWFNKAELVDLTDCFMSSDFLWGGAWTEMALRWWHESRIPSEEILVISFPKYRRGVRPPYFYFAHGN